jgi:hypothetical protein
MDRQPLIAAILLVGACRVDPPYEGAFEIPVAAGILQPEPGSPFDEPVAYVANGHGGQIVPILLKQGTFLVDDKTVSFLPANQLATGARRVLTSAAAYATPQCAQITAGAGAAECQVVVFAGDAWRGTLLEVPHISKFLGGVPVEGWFDDEGEWPDEPTWDRLGDGDREETDDDITVLDADPSDGTPHLTDLFLKKGWTTTETWTVQWNGVDAWTVEGSASGRQERTAQSGRPYEADAHRVAFLLDRDGSCADGLCDTITFETRTGIRELDVGGTPLALALSPDRTRLAMIVQDRALGAPVVRFLDPRTRTQTGDLPLPPDARPGRLSWGEGGTRLFVSDYARSSAWSVDVQAGDALTEIAFPSPTLDAANLIGEDRDRLFALGSDGTTLWTADLATGEILDANPYMAGTQGMVMQAPVAGIEAIPLAHFYTSYDDEGVRRTGRSVAIALTTGAVMFLEETTGCMMPDVYGPRTLVTGSYGAILDYTVNFDADNALSPFLQANAINDRHVMVSQCAGIAFEETWVLTYDRNLTAWRVEGSRSGEQVPAFEDQRYATADGAVSFLVRAGGFPSEQGYTMGFDVLDGIATALGDQDADGTPEWLLANPADPIFFSYRVGPTFGGWKVNDERAFALVLGQASDRVGRVDPQEADIDIPWE